jgi:hypothetical protein
MTVEGMYSKLTTNRRQDFINFRLPRTGLIVTNPVIQDNFVVAGSTSGTVQTAGTQRNEPTTTYLGAVNAKYDNGTLKVTADASYTRVTLVQTIEVITLQSLAPVTGTFDFRAGPSPSLVLGTATLHRLMRPITPISHQRLETSEAAAFSDCLTNMLLVLISATS